MSQRLIYNSRDIQMQIGQRMLKKKEHIHSLLQFGLCYDFIDEQELDICCTQH